MAGAGKVATQVKEETHSQAFALAWVVKRVVVVRLENPPHV